MNFASDNVTGVAPEILAALAAVNDGPSAAYGDDAVTARLEARMAKIFETEVTVFPVATGSAANALALSAVTPPYGAIYCHAAAHINVDECGAPEFFTGGAKLVDLPGPDGKLTAGDLAEVLAGAGKGVVHHVQPAAVSLTQATECGTVYSPDELRAIADLAHGHGLAVHMDGARFANAAASLGRSPADLTWRAGIDLMSFGATKNGALAAEAVVFFDRARAADFGFRRKRAGHLFSKMRFLSAQLEAYLTDGLWLRNAAHANRMAARIADGLDRLDGAELVYPVQANEVFVRLPEPVIAGLLADGFTFYRWDGPTGRVVRLVTAFNTGPAAVEALLAAAERHATPGMERAAG
jgi:threonine aldolase